MKQLTARQAEVLDLVRSHIADTGYPPTRADIARQLGFRSANAAEEHLKALARKGALEIVPGTSRGIRLPVDEGLPVVGRVAAGSPILAQEHIEETCNVPPDMFRPAADFLLRVEGDSMVDAGILDGDLLAVHKTPEAASGAIIVARIDDDVTVKRLRRKSRTRVVLEAENEAYDPIEVDLRNQDLVIEGLSVGVIRREL
ncbi:MAG: transcriptional repressor LexA [Gammaproteobacteria bacterium]|nr:transcriptional repressor LexA [Gammaproteobacteria bacterium]MDE0443676.1 transcriptional repressor LexA [Gammaproteobacteria bacterium]